MAVINLKHDFVTPSVRFLRGHHFRTNVEGKMRARKLKYSIRFDARARTTLSLVSEGELVDRKKSIDRKPYKLT